MRYLVVAVAALMLSLPSVTPATACGAAAKSAQVATATFSADEMKPKKKVAKKKAKKKEKVEYMRAVPTEPPKK